MLDQISWREIRQLITQHKQSLIIANVFAILATLCSVPIPLLMPILVDEVILGQGDQALRVMNHFLPALWQQALGYVGLIVLVSLLLRTLSLVFNVAQSRLFAIVSKHIVYQVRLRLIGRLQRISLQEYESLGSGSVATHLVTDIGTLDSFIGDTLSRVVVAALSILGTAAILLWMNWKLALLILCFNPIVVLATIKLGRRVRHLKRMENDSTGRFTQALTETLDAIQEVRSSNRQGYFMGRLQHCAEEVRDYSVASQWKKDASARASGLLFQFGIDVFRAAAILTVIFSDLTVGQMLAVFSYPWFMIGPMDQLLNLQYTFYAANGAMERINQLLARADEPQYPAQINPFAGKETVSIEVDQLNFTYQSEPVLKNLSLTVAAGEKVAIVGASGGGKSTLVQLLLGLYQPQSGRIAYAGVDFTQIGAEQVREHVAVVLQHPAMFNDTVRANLTLGRERDDAACWHALELACLRETIEQLPEGLDSVLGRSGVRLSGGQRQRLAIARMILARPKVVILDEATSALDALTEYHVHRNLSDFLKGTTTLIIAHRLSAVRQADRVMVFDGGQVAEQGSHQALLAQGGLYSKLYGHLQQ